MVSLQFFIQPPQLIFALVLAALKFALFCLVPLPSVKHARANELQQLGFVEVATNQYKLGRGLLRILPFTLLKCEAGAAQVEDVAHFVVTPEP